MSVGPSGAPARPAIVVIDADPVSLGRVHEELRRRYGSDYRIVTAAGPESLPDVLDECAGGGGEVALVLAGQRSAGDGEAILARVAARFPHAKRGLLVDFGAWRDEATSRAILGAMARGAMDYYVLTPWRSPDELFHRTIAEFLHEWSRQHAAGPRELVLVGRDDGRTAALRALLSRNGIPHACLAPADPAAAELLARAGADAASGPVVGFHDGRLLVDPSDLELADAFGFRTTVPRDEVDVLIVGAGPAGLAAAVYAAADGLDTLVIEREAIGGQAGSSSLIRNYLGFARGISGADLAMRAYQQAWVFGASVVMMRSARSLEADGDRVAVTLSDGTRVRAGAVILAMGVAYRRVEVPELEALVGAGVHYGAAISEAPAFEGRRVYVLGGGNSAGQAALHLARYAREVTVVVRGAGLAGSMSRYLVRQLEAAAPRVRIRTGCRVVGGGDPGRLRHLDLLEDGATRRVPADGLFVMIGARPHTDWLPDEVARDDWGFVLTGADLPAGGMEQFATGMPGVYAAGDVRHGSLKRVGSAVGEGAGVVREVYRRVRESGGAGP